VTQVAEKIATGSRGARSTSSPNGGGAAGRRAAALSRLGYARTSLREIAQNSEFSHGVLHYYFRDKADSSWPAVRQYNAYCVTRYDQIVATSQSLAS